MNARSRWRALLGGALLWLAACEPGKTHILGRVPEADEDEDAGAVDRDAAPRDDADLPPCWEHDDCDTKARPYCSDYLGYCVACTRDRHCGDPSYWFCRDRNGTCVERDRD